MSIFEPDSLAIVAEKLRAQLVEDVCRHFLGNYRNFLQFEIVVRFRTRGQKRGRCLGDRKSTRLNSSHLVISYAVFCLKKKKESLTDRLFQLENEEDIRN